MILTLLKWSALVTTSVAVDAAALAWWLLVYSHI